MINFASAVSFPRRRGKGCRIRSGRNNVESDNRSKRMKVLLIYLGRRGGGEAYGLSIAKRLVQHAEMKVMISKHAESIDRWRKDIGDLYEIDTYTTRFEFVKKTLIRKTIFEIAAIVDKEMPDIVYYPMLSPWTFMIISCIHYGKTVSTIHDLKLHLGERNPVISYITSKSIRQSDGLIFLNKYLQEQFSKRDKNKLTETIPLGAFDFYLKDEEDRYSTVNGRANILFFGRILRYKGLDVLLKAYPKIKESIPNSRLIIAGQGNITPYRKQLNICSDVSVYNNYLTNDEINDLMKEGDILVLPYIDASQSGVLTMGQAYGMPVIATKICGIQEQIENGVTGVLAEPGNSAQLAGEYVRLLQDSSLRNSLSRNEIQFARNSLSWENIAQRILLFFERVLSATARTN
jgi:glycosyltransferase involved in cell wall biosynthesis